MEEALSKGTPEVFNTDQGSQFTGEPFPGLLEQHGVRISPDECGTFGMDGKGRYADNILLDRLWRTVKYEEVYLKAYSNGREAKAGLDVYFSFYNNQRPHQALGYRTPAEVHSTASDEPSKEVDGHGTVHRQTLEIRRDSHLVLPQTCPTNGVHLSYS